MLEFLSEHPSSCAVIQLNPPLLDHLPEIDVFESVIQSSRGDIHRVVKNRRTVKIRFGGKFYFVKIHRSVGFREILKNLLYARRAVVSAENEWLAIAKLKMVGIPTMTLVGKGIRGGSPASVESFVVTEALEGMISLEDFTHDWRKLESARRNQVKRMLLKQVASIARVMHKNGMNHRDFYLCHFLVKDRDWSQWQRNEPLLLHLIDLHRVQQRAVVPRRWLVKDLGGLLFSALDAGLTRRDLLRFIEAYRQRQWRTVLHEEHRFWRQVWRNAAALYRSFHHREPPLRFDAL